MKVYAEYFEENGLTFRRNTILQFGDSWNLIGNVVLANSGSAEPMNIIDNDNMVNLKHFYEKYRDGSGLDQKNWYEFSPDQTMKRVEKIFNGGYVNESKELNGVIQLFNVFNIKNQNMEEAIKQIGVDSPLLFSEGIENYFHDKPTYFGFSQEILNNDILRPVAENIFENAGEEVKKIYKKKFEDNKFYHPTYINRASNQEHFQWYKEEVLTQFI